MDKENSRDHAVANDIEKVLEEKQTKNNSGVRKI